MFRNVKLTVKKASTFSVLHNIKVTSELVTFTDMDTVVAQHGHGYSGPDILVPLDVWRLIEGVPGAMLEVLASGEALATTPGGVHARFQPEDVDSYPTIDLSGKYVGKVEDWKAAIARRLEHQSDEYPLTVADGRMVLTDGHTMAIVPISTLDLGAPMGLHVDSYAKRALKGLKGPVELRRTEAYLRFTDERSSVSLRITGRELAHASERLFNDLKVKHEFRLFDSTVVEFKRFKKGTVTFLENEAVVQNADGVQVGSVFFGVDAPEFRFNVEYLNRLLRESGSLSLARGPILATTADDGTRLLAMGIA